MENNQVPMEPTSEQQVQMQVPVPNATAVLVFFLSLLAGVMDCQELSLA